IPPLVLHEKALALRYGGLDAAYAHEHGERLVFHANLSDRTKASALDTAVLIEQSIEQQLRPLARVAASGPIVTDTAGCPDPWRHYCHSVAIAVEYALSRHE